MSTEKKTPEQFAANLKTFGPGLHKYVKLGHIAKGVKNKKGELRDLFNMPFKTSASGDKNAVYSTQSAWNVADRYTKGEFVDVIINELGFIDKMTKSVAATKPQAQVAITSGIADANASIEGSSESTDDLPF